MINSSTATLTPCRLGARRRAGRLAALLTGAALLAGCTYTEPFTDSSGKVLDNSVASMETITLGGVPQRIWIRGSDKRNRPLILVHGGPGASESPLFRAYTPGLERHFVVVYWDQRGAGRSYSKEIPDESMKISQFVAELGELVDLVRARLGVQKAVILGHSWGTVPGLLYAHEHPDKVLAYVGVAPIADMPRGEHRSWSWALERARSERDEEAIADLTQIGPPLHDVKEMLISRKWVDHFGGSFHTDMDMGDLIWAAIRTSEVNFYDLVLFGRGIRYSLEAMWPELRETSLTHLTQFATPIFFLLGRHEMPRACESRMRERCKAGAGALNSKPARKPACTNSKNFSRSNKSMGSYISQPSQGSRRNSRGRLNSALAR